jgi:DNA-binding transcriptional MerR regulator
VSTNAEYSLDQLCTAAASALGQDYSGVANGQVRDVPDARTVRYYTTLGLIDRPTVRGRVGYYHHRHLLQLVAVKRLQATGASLRDVQLALVGRTDAELAEIARLPEVPTPVPPKPESEIPFWKRPPVPVPAPAKAEPVRVRETATAIVLDAGVILVVENPPPNLDPAALRAAAAPLIQMLSRDSTPRRNP